MSIRIALNPNTESQAERDIYRMAELLGAAPEELLYVGDDPFNDVGGAYAAGYTPVWVKTSGIWPEGERRAPYEIDNLRGLPPLLDRLT